MNKRPLGEDMLIQMITHNRMMIKDLSVVLKELTKRQKTLEKNSEREIKELWKYITGLSK